MAISLSACNQNPDQHAVVYNTSVDVPLQHWTSADTLFYPLDVAEQPSITHPIRLRKNYHVRISMRHTADFPLTEVPANLFLQKTDSVQGQVRVSRRVMQASIAPRICDEDNSLLGEGWGSLFCHQESLSDVTLRFDQAGSYRILFIPAFKEIPDGIDGMASVGIELYE